MKWVKDDGGRAAAGFKGSTGDCACRAAAIATGQPYATVYAALNLAASRERRIKGRSSAREGVHKATMRRYMASLGWTWTPTMRIGSGCTVHLRADELPTGRLVVAVSKHYTAVIDGVIHDTFDPSDRPVTVYSRNTLENIPRGATRMDNGDWMYAPERCVYGYWSAPSTPRERGKQP
jgi:hypothetical protein